MRIPTSGPPGDCGPTLSIVIPAWNEERRLPPFLDRIHDHLGGSDGESYEVVVVDDGSDDGTSAAVLGRSRDWPELRLLRHPLNLGKGAALRSGIAAAVGELVLLADADGATPLADFRRLSRAVEEGADVAVGSRLVGGEGTVVRRSAGRAACSLAFSRLANALFDLQVRDTQCGFKLFRRQAGLRAVQLCREQGYLLDLELLASCRQLGLSVREVPVSWDDVPGSKVHFPGDAWRMFCGLLRLRLALRRPVAATSSAVNRPVPPPPAAAGLTLDA